MTLNEIKQKINNNDIALFIKGTYKDYKNLYMTVEVARLTNEVQFLYDRELQWEQNTISSI